jgi:hypothetical protein
LIPLVHAIEECQRVQDPQDIPCYIISSWHPSEDVAGASCSDYNLSIINGSGVIIQNHTWGDYFPACNVTFNLTTSGNYQYNSSLEDGNIVVRGARMWLLAILLIPVLLCFFFVYYANTIEEVHNPLRWFFRLIALIMIFVVYQGAHTIIGYYPAYSDLSRMFSITVYGWIFWVIMAYFLVYILYNIFMSFKHNKEWEWNEKWMK